MIPVRNIGAMKIISSHFMPQFTLLLLYGVVVNAETGKCPNICVCQTSYHPTEGPTKGVVCNVGGMTSIPTEDLEPDIYELTISPKSNEPNSLTIGPIFTQPVTFTNLRTLKITNSNVPVIGTHSFWGLQNLRTLNLTSNHLSNISMENFRGLLNLTTLALDYNRIETMASETFHYMIGLVRLTLSHNRISTLVPRLFRMLVKLEVLDLSSNPIEDLNPEIFKDIQNLKEFKCRSCHLRVINVQIYHIVPLIEELDLGDNLFKFLANDNFIDLKKLKKLRLDRNEIPVILDNTFKENKQLKHLDISYNHIVLLTPGCLNNLSKLSHLDVSFNHIVKFDLNTFSSSAKSLRSISLSGNNLPLKEVSALIEFLPGIREMGLANLSLKFLTPTFFTHNKHLTSLDLSSNMLEQFPFTIMSDTKYLQHLDLSHNKITILKETHLRRLEAIAKIDLTSNEWNCQCPIKTVLNFMRTTVLNESLRVLQCHTPVQLRGIYFGNLTESQLEPCFASTDVQMSIVTGISFVTSSILLTILIALCWSRRCRRQYEKEVGKRNEVMLTSVTSDNESGVHPVPES